MTCSVRISSQLCFKQGCHLASAYGVSFGVLFMLSSCEYGVPRYSRMIFFFFFKQKILPLCLLFAGFLHILVVWEINVISWELFLWRHQKKYLWMWNSSLRRQNKLRMFHKEQYESMLVVFLFSWGKKDPLHQWPSLYSLVLMGSWHNYGFTVMWVDGKKKDENH